MLLSARWAYDWKNMIRVVDVGVWHNFVVYIDIVAENVFRARSQLITEWWKCKSVADGVDERSLCVGGSDRRLNARSG